jgi:hypothetical protein
VYRDHLRTKWWGWFDADQLIGNFEHLLPRDIMKYVHYGFSSRQLYIADTLIAAISI